MVIGKSGGGTGGGQVVGKKVAPVKQAIAQIKAGHVRILAITEQFMFVHHYIFHDFCQRLGHSLKITALQHQILGGRGHVVGC